eukprot:COSAG04_NODE_91_length_26852_cov_8.609315_14_plen_192_part_00
MARTAFARSMTSRPGAPAAALLSSTTCTRPAPFPPDFCAEISSAHPPRTLFGQEADQSGDRNAVNPRDFRERNRVLGVPRRAESASALAARASEPPAPAPSTVCSVYPARTILAEIFGERRPDSGEGRAAYRCRRGRRRGPTPPPSALCAPQTIRPSCQRPILPLGKSAAAKKTAGGLAARTRGSRGPAGG